jgi:hypothetical protein
MMRSEPGADDTVSGGGPVPQQSGGALAVAQPRGSWQWVIVGAAVAVLAMGLVGWLVWPRQASTPVSAPQLAGQPAPAQRPMPAQQPAPGPQPAPAGQAPTRSVIIQSGPTQQAPAQQAPAQPATAPATPQAPSATPAPFPIETADEAEILAHVATGLTVFRFAANPSIIVLDFASLHQQGMMLNRIAALIEKGAMPRDRVLNDTELDAAITAGGDTVETFYYGHDYSAEAMARFFILASKQNILLNPEEEKLHQLLAQLGWLAPDVHGGLISVPKVGANAEVTAAARRAILRHELSHGEYFSDPAYAAYVHQFWVHDLTQTERDGFRNFLASEEYDTKIEELVENEMQAYLMFTRDPVFFAPSKIGMKPERLAELQVAFQRHMPHGWLRDVLGQTLPTATSPY